jgi:hypothetical protein
MSEIIAVAMHYIEEKERSNGRELIVGIWFNSREIEHYQLRIVTGPTIDIITSRDGVDSVDGVGNIVSEKWSIETIFEDTCYGPPDQIQGALDTVKLFDLML